MKIKIFNKAILNGEYVTFVDIEGLTFIIDEDDIMMTSSRRVDFSESRETDYDISDDSKEYIYLANYTYDDIVSCCNSIVFVPNTMELLDINESKSELIGYVDLNNRTILSKDDNEKDTAVSNAANYIICLNSYYRDYASGDTYEEPYAIFSVMAKSYDDAKNKALHLLQENGIKWSENYSVITENQALAMVNSEDDWKCRIYKNNIGKELLDIEEDK